MEPTFSGQYVWVVYDVLAAMDAANDGDTNVIAVTPTLGNLWATMAQYKSELIERGEDFPFKLLDMPEDTDDLFRVDVAIDTESVIFRAKRVSVNRIHI